MSPNCKAPVRPTVLVTGASRGVGLALVRAIHTHGGYRPVAAMRDMRGRNCGVAGDLRELGIRVVELDVSSDESVADGVAAALEAVGSIDILVNNAGVATFGAIESATIDDLRAQFDTNVLGPHRVTRAVLPGMRRARHGLVVQISSGAGRYTIPGRGCYAASKWALEAMSDTLRWEVAQFNIDVVIIELGPVKSNLQSAKRYTTDETVAGAYRSLYDTIDKELTDREAADGEVPASAVTGPLLELFGQKPGSRPFRLALHPNAQRLDEYNAALEILIRDIFQARGYLTFLPA
jgi:NAD(P)-dependent dehydrogenase (short-subunit alcohol dehydrogenase family)